mmetsp:Transcript_12345/g.18718  ORF Transcript_12345/g.18718 Transcript_12345/m.18718 type:complete len:402 (+) Transcript_12345:67-1272(+)
MAEKYTRWADKSNGINPFVSDEARAYKSFTGRVISTIVTVLVGIPKLIIVTILFMLSACVNIIFHEVGLLLAAIGVGSMCHYSNQSPLPAIIVGCISAAMLLPLPFTSPITLIRRSISRVITYVCLFLIGVDYRVSMANTSRVVGVRSDSKSAPPPLSHIMPGDLVISNITSVLEILFYESICSPLYVFPVRLTPSSSHEPSLYHCPAVGFFSALRISMSPSISQSQTSDVKRQTLTAVLQQAKSAGRCVIIFPEGVRSNGSGVLKFPEEIFCDISTVNTSIHLAGFTYPSASTQPCCPVGSQVLRIISTCGALSLPCAGRLLVLPSKYLSEIHQKLSTRNKSSAVRNWTNEVRNIFAKLINKKTVELGVDDFESFRSYSDAMKSGDMELARKIADSRIKK